MSRFYGLKKMSPCGAVQGKVTDLGSSARRTDLTPDDEMFFVNVICGMKRQSAALSVRSLFLSLPCLTVCNELYLHLRQLESCSSVNCL